MSEDVEELFGEGTGHAEPRTRLVWGLLISGLVLTVLGVVCTSAPGGLLVLAAWGVVEKELDRVETGYLPADVRPRILRLQRINLAALVFVVVVFLAQSVLLCMGAYDALWGSMLQGLYDVLGLTPVEAPAPVGP